MGRRLFVFRCGATDPLATDGISGELAALIDELNTQFNGCLASDGDIVFARVYDRYLTSNKGSSVDSVFTDSNDAGSEQAHAVNRPLDGVRDLHPRRACVRLFGTLLLSARRDAERSLSLLAVTP